jgi:hypothetical protein
MSLEEAEIAISVNMSFARIWVSPWLLGAAVVRRGGCTSPVGKCTYSLRLQHDCRMIATGYSRSPSRTSADVIGTPRPVTWPRQARTGLGIGRTALTYQANPT